MANTPTAPSLTERADLFATLVFKDEVKSKNAAAFIAGYCENAFVRLQVHARAAQQKCADKERDLTLLAGKVKYVRAHLELAQCYGRQIAIMSENDMFRSHAISYLSLAHAELEALEYFDPNN